MSNSVFEFLCNVGMFIAIVIISLVFYVAIERFDESYEQQNDDEIKS